MKRTSLFFAASLLLVATTSLTSCQKDEETDPIVTEMQQDDDATAYYSDVDTEVDELTMVDVSKSMDYSDLITTGQGTRTRTTSWDGDWKVDTITYVDFVNGNSRFQRVKNGQIIIRTLGRYINTEFIRIVTFKDFTINGNLIEGVRTITKTGDYTFDISLDNGKITFTDGTTYTRTFTRTRTWVDGFSTPYNIWDDVYTIEGTATGVNRKGNAYTHQITNALMIKLNCRWIVSGTIEITVGDKTATLDYGNGECDNMATVTKDGKSYEVRLRGL